MLCYHVANVSIYFGYTIILSHFFVKNCIKVKNSVDMALPYPQSSLYLQEQIFRLISEDSDQRQEREAWGLHQ